MSVTVIEVRFPYTGLMVRWRPGTPERLRAASLDLFESHGFEQTTVTEIAAAVGLTERTFFRHFADKREVLFAGEEVLQQRFLVGIAHAPAQATAFELVAASLAASADFFPDEQREFSRRRQQVIGANRALKERELFKLASLSTALAEAMRGRGLPEPTASVAAESTVGVFGVAFAAWIGQGETRSLGELERVGLDALDQLVR